MTFIQAVFLSIPIYLVYLFFKKRHYIFFSTFLFSTLIYGRLTPVNLFPSLPSITPLKVFYIALTGFGTFAYIERFRDSGDSKKEIIFDFLFLLAIPAFFYFLLPYVVSYFFNGRLSPLEFAEDSRVFFILIFIYPFAKNILLSETFRKLKLYFYIALLFVAPSTIIFYLKYGLSFHRMRYGQLGIIEQHPWIVGKFPEFMTQEALFNLNARSGVFLMVAICTLLPISFSRLHQISNWANKLLSFALFAAFFFFICILNFLNMQLSIALTILFYFGFQLVKMDQLKRIGDTCLVGLIFIVTLIVNNNLIPEKHHYNKISGRVPDTRIQIIQKKDGSYVPVNTERDQTASTHEANRIQMMELALLNLIQARPLVGHGQPMSQTERSSWSSELFRLSGHSRFVDQLAIYGLIGTPFRTFIIWFPLLFLLITKIRYSSLTLDPETTALFSYFLSSFLASFFGNWGIHPIENSIQILMIWLMLVETRKHSVWQWPRGKTL